MIPDSKSAFVEIVNYDNLESLVNDRDNAVKLLNNGKIVRIYASNFTTGYIESILKDRGFHRCAIRRGGKKYDYATIRYEYVLGG